MHSPAVAENKEYEEILSFLYSLDRFGILLGLDNISSLLDKMGNPQHRFPSIHVAGSNGKGSTCSYINNILQDAGLNAALYTSPHLNDFRERVRINGKMASKESLTASARKVRELYDPSRTTFFEFTTAMAFDCMAKAAPDIAVIEVGLGGRLDATNTINPRLTVITDISREHEDYLGVGLASVAREKAGIIKPGIPLITGASRKEAQKVILEIAARLGAPVWQFGKDFWGKRSGKQDFTYVSSSLRLDEVRLNMPGSHQIKNASAAIAAVEQLRVCGYNISEEAIRSGLLKTKFAGRFELLGKKPDIIIDGAHTPEGMRLLKSTMKRLYPDKSPILLLGILKDKNFELLTSIIAPIAKEAVCVMPQGNRALESEELAAEVRRHGVKAVAADSISEGFEIALKNALPEDVVLAAGSLYMIGPVRRACGFGDD